MCANRALAAWSSASRCDYSSSRTTASAASGAGRVLQTCATRMAEDWWVPGVAMNRSKSPPSRESGGGVGVGLCRA